MRIICPSHGRADQVAQGVMKVFPNHVEFLVAEDEVEEYEQKTGRPVIGHPCGVGHLGRIKNWMLDNVVDVECVVNVDDDLHYVGIVLQEPGPRLLRMSEDLLVNCLHQVCQCASDLGTNLFFLGTGYPMRYQDFNPFMLRTICWGGLVGYIDDGQRYDESLQYHTDIDFTLQTLARHRRVWQDTRFTAVWTVFTNKGGYASVRSNEMLHEQTRKLRKKWGQDVVRTGQYSKAGRQVSIRVPK